MSFQFYPYVTKQISVVATATPILAANASRSGLLLVNHGSVDVYIGAADVTTATGVLLTGSKGASIAFCATAAIYGITGGGSQTISVLETQ